MQNHHSLYQVAKHFRYCFLFYQVVNTNYETGNRTHVTRQADIANSSNFSGDVIVRDAGENIIERTISYVIPRQALLIARINNLYFTQYFILLKIFFHPI